MLNELAYVNPCIRSKKRNSQPYVAVAYWLWSNPIRMQIAQVLCWPSHTEHIYSKHFIYSCHIPIMQWRSYSPSAMRGWKLNKGQLCIIYMIMLHCVVLYRVGDTGYGQNNKYIGYYRAACFCIISSVLYMLYCSYNLTNTIRLCSFLFFCYKAIYVKVYYSFWSVKSKRKYLFPYLIHWLCFPQHEAQWRFVKVFEGQIASLMSGISEAFTKAFHSRRVLRITLLGNGSKDHLYSGLKMYFNIMDHQITNHPS